MSYNPNIPASGDDPTVSQGQLLNNFGVLNTDFAVDHVAMTLAQNAGMHKQITFPAAIAHPVASGSQSFAYPFSYLDAVTATATNELFFKNGNNLSSIKQLTNIGVANGIITAATQANPCKITSANHGLSTGNTIVITQVLGMTQLNGNTYTITKVDANSFTLNGTNSSAYGAYTAGGIWTNSGISNFGFTLPSGLIINCGSTTTANTFFAVPYSTQVYSALATTNVSTTTNPAVVVAIALNSITIGGTPTSFNYFCIGK